MSSLKQTDGWTVVDGFDDDQRLASTATSGRFRGLWFEIRLRPDGTIDHFAIRSKTDGPPITAELLRSVPIGGLRDELVRRARKRASSPKLRARYRSWAEDFAAQPRPGSRGRDLTEYALVASAYVDALGRRAPIQEVANLFHLSVSQARNLVWHAREKGLLTESSPGRAGGVLTPLAIELLLEVETDGSR